MPNHIESCDKARNLRNEALFTINYSLLIIQYYLFPHPLLKIRHLLPAHNRLFIYYWFQVKH
jgi:hypothetical protein